MDPVTPLYVSIAASIASILLILVVFELIRSRRLRERYALLWLATGLVLLVLSAWRGGLDTIAGWVGVTGYPPAVLFAVATLASILLILVVFELIRSRRLRERYALLWLATGVVLLVLSAWRGGLNTIARWLGVTGYPPAVLFAVGLLFVVLVLLHYSTVISKLADQNVILAQKLALLERRVAESKER